MGMSFANVAVAAPLFQAFTYAVPEGMPIAVGQRVVVPFGRKRRIGYVTELVASAPTMAIKPIEEILDLDPSLSPALMELIQWMSRYYFSPIGELCRGALPGTLSLLSKKAGKPRSTPHELGDSFTSTTSHPLTPAQQAIVDAVSPAIDAKQFSPLLLHGITGSGKTEIYLELFAHSLTSNRQALFLVPEIGLTPQLTGRVVSRFPGQVAIYHSGLTDSQRHREWQKIRSGEANIVVGTRSALFAPFRHLGIIVVDEEHDSSYKQDEAPRYHGRDGAIMRAKIESVPIVLGSATPSLESYLNAQRKKYTYLHLPERVGGAVLPPIELVDMRVGDKHPSFYLSYQLACAIEETLEKKRQTILFLNRRGFSSFTICSDCGTSPTCPNCSISLTHHRHPDVLLCHYCDYTIPLPPCCPNCKSKKFKPLGLGTQRLETELKEFFPDARISRLDRDTASSHHQRMDILGEMKRGETDILIGTQMITKGHDFPGVDLVGIISADTSLHLPDFRAAERTFQLLTQTSGRAGRTIDPARVIIQTLSPEHYSLQHAATHDFLSFANTELGHREELEYPPFFKMAAIRIVGNIEERVVQVANSLPSLLTDSEQLCVRGPAPAPLAKVRGKFRWHLLIKTSSHAHLHDMLSRIQRYAIEQCPSGVNVQIDVDPVHMM